MIVSRSAIPGIAAAVLWPVLAAAQTPAINPQAAPRPRATAVRIHTPIVVDGVLEDEAWRAVEPLSGFIQSKPQTGRPASESTEVRIVYDDQNLYIGAFCFDSEPEKLVVPSLEQDFDSVNSDIFGITLDTFLDRRNGFMFLVNPGGAMKDVQIFDDSRSENQAWEGALHVRTRRDARGWSVELAIPFTTLRFDPSVREHVWGMNLLRRIRRKNEDSFWAPLDRRHQIHRMSRAGLLDGLTDLRAGRNFWLKPYVLGGSTTGAALPPGIDRGGDFDGGLDLKYGVTPQLTLDLTLRTDFSQVEVDQEQVNLTRFSLFFPEKRDFFVENSGTFSFGDLTERNYRLGATLQDFSLFHSRRIGLTPSGQPLPILGGARLTGKAAGFQVGLLNMQTEARGSSPAENFTVLRLRRNVRGRADVGFLLTNRQKTSEGPGVAYNRSFGVDANVRFLNNLIVNTYAAATAQPGLTGDQGAGRVTVGWRDRLWNAAAFVKQVGDGFRPAMGFVRRGSMRQHYATVGIHPQPSIRFVQEVNPYVEMDYITDLNSVLETRTVNYGLDTQFLDGGSLEVEYRDAFERVFQPFRVSGNATVRAGDYDFRELGVAYRSSAGRRFSGRAGLSTGGYFGGEKTTLNASLAWRARPRLAFDLSLDRSDITLDGRSFSTDLIGLRARASLSTVFFASGFFQYNSAADHRVLNFRLDYIHSPLSDLFVVYTERRDSSGGGVLERAFTVKLTRLLAF